MNPAEVLGNRIFSQNGGFVFLHKEDVDLAHWEKDPPEAVLLSPFSEDKGGKSRYFPVVPVEVGVRVGSILLRDHARMLMHSSPLRRVTT